MCVYNSDAVPGVSRAQKNNDRVERARYIYKQLRDCTHIGGSHRNVFALTSRQNTYQHRLAFSAGIDIPNIDVTKPTLPKKTRASTSIKIDAQLIFTGPSSSQAEKIKEA
jgi:hypothetical protein